ncbi:MAG: sulfatase-like hydrolase/transferase, partial [Verrucomicrobiota bacterium]
MKTRTSIKTNILLYSLYLIAVNILAANDTRDRPNILFILCDDLGWNDVGYNGASYQLTPNIDKLSEQSLILHRSYARPTCAPSRASLFTGDNSAHTKIYHVKQYYGVQPDKFEVSPPKSGHHYTEPIAMLSDTLKSAGYTTGYVGKWHVTKDPTENGFDFNAGGWRKGGPASYFSPYKNPMLADGPEGEYLPERMADESIGFIKRNKDKPFFLCYAPYSVHYPVQARPEDINFFKKRTKDHEQQLPVYAAMVYALDQAIGRVLDALESEGLIENTLIVFTSDNGHNGRGVPAILGSGRSVVDGGRRHHGPGGDVGGGAGGDERGGGVQQDRLAGSPRRVVEEVA